MSIIPVTIPPKTLAQTISSTATSFKLNNILNWQGVALTPADFGTEAFCVFTNSTKTQIEIFKFDPATIADASISIISRGLDYSGGLVPALNRQYAWASNDTIVQLGTDAPQLFREFLSQSNPATVTALLTFNVLPRSSQVPTDGDDFTNKDYVDGLTQPAITVPINQVNHNLVVGDVIRISGIDTYAKAQANTPANAEVIGIVVEVVDADNFKYITEGITTAGVGIHPAGTVLFLSPTTPGLLTATEPSAIGQVSLPLAIVTQSSVRMIFHKYRGIQLNTIAGNPIASETIAGIVEQATPAQVAAQTDVGETGAPLFVVPSLIPVVAAPVVTDYLVGSTWNKPAGLRRAIIELWAAGGGGGRSANTFAGGGGGGAYYKLELREDELPSSVAFTIGVGGAGASVIGPGAAGGNTVFGSLATVYGGGGGAGSNSYGGGGGGGFFSAGATTTTNTGGAGGSPTPGISTSLDSVYGGGIGATITVHGAGKSIYGGGGGAGGSSIYGGGGGGNGPSAAGGTSLFGGAGGAGAAGGVGAGNPGVVPAGGGGGGTTGGGAGANGKIRITEYF